MFGGLKILVLYGDPESLAGWGLAYKSFSVESNSMVGGWIRQTGADVITCTHTCLPASLLPVHFDHAAWLSRFDQLWPEGSDAAESYRKRLLFGTSLHSGQLVSAGDI